MKIKDYFLVMAIVMTCSLTSRAQISVVDDIKCNGGSTGALMAMPAGWGISPLHIFGVPVNLQIQLPTLVQVLTLLQ